MAAGKMPETGSALAAILTPETCTLVQFHTSRKEATMNRNSIVSTALVIAMALAMAPVALAGSGEPHLGVYLQELNDDLRDHFAYDGAGGVLIMEVIDDTGADRAGLKGEDIITSVNGEEITGVGDVKKAVRKMETGEVADIEIFRDKARREFVVEITEREQAPRYSARKWVYFPPDDRPWVGIHMEDLNPQMADYFGVESGILIKEVAEDSPAEDAKLAAGDVIIAWEEKDIDDSEDFLRQLEGSDPGDKVRLTLMRKGKRKKVKITLAEPDEDSSSLYGFYPGEEESHSPHYRYRRPEIRRLPLPYFGYPHRDGPRGFSRAEPRLDELEKEIEQLREEVHRLTEKLEERAGADE